MHRLILAVLIVVLVSTSCLFAGTPGSITCPSPPNCQLCTRTNGQGQKSCTIRIFNSSGTAAAQVVDLDGHVLGSPNQNICLDSSVPVSFQSDPNNPTAYFGIVFGTSNPFSSFSGKAVVVPGGTIAGAPAAAPLSLSVPATPPACYSYFISYCEYSAMTLAKCLTQDPQVIVDGGQIVRTQ